MVFCSVPFCGVDSWTCDPTITFHEFPANPDQAAKWIQQINSANISKHKPMWFPRGKSMVCSKHFLQTDFKDDSDTLKPRVVPTVFGHRYIGVNRAVADQLSEATETKTSPLIVNLIRPAAKSNILTSGTRSYSAKTSSKDATSETIPISSPNSADSDFSPQQSAGGVSNSNSATPTLGFSFNHSSNSNISVKRKGPDIPKISLNTKNAIKKHKAGVKANSKNELIEIGPNTFLKINPEVIKVNKKQTPSGNTVLQFLMDQKLANSQAASDLFPKIVHGTTASVSMGKKGKVFQSTDKPETTNMNVNSSEDNTVQHAVLGHLIDTHICKSARTELVPNNKDVDVEEGDLPTSLDDVPNSSEEVPTSLDDAVPSTSADILEGKQNLVNKAPVLFTTTIPLSHCFVDKSKSLTQLKQKSRQIASLKFKIAALTKKVEELEDKCIVQERQLSYSFIKRLKTIRKNSDNGDACATYLLEQIRCYAGKNKMRWSDSTLSQCAVWCRKAPYAYEYFKKADFFKLPCVGTVKRFMKKHPELKFMNKTNTSMPNNDDSSSDFDFDDSDSDKDCKGNTDGEDSGEPVTADETQSGGSTQPQQATPKKQTTNTEVQEHTKLVKTSDIGAFPMTVDGANLEVQEIILPSGEVVQCYSSNICNGSDVGNQYYIIPNVDQSSGVEHEYNVVQASDSMPVILQNLENAQLPLQQEQLIFITNSEDQLECTETEVSTASV